MGTIATSTSAQATAFGNQRRTDRCQNGVQWTISTPAANASVLTAAYSTDGGNTWSTISGPSVGSGAYFTSASVFLDIDDFMHIVYKDGNDGYIKYTRGTPNAARTSYTWSAPIVLWDGSNYDYPDIAVCRDPANSGAWVALAVASRLGSTNTQKVFGWTLRIASNGTVTGAGGAAAINIGANLAASNTNPAYASVDFNHTGDGKTVKDGAPHWYVGWSGGATGDGYGIRFRKASYSGGSWTWGTEREIDNTRHGGNFANGYWLNTVFDGTRVVLAGLLTPSDLVMYERDAADTTTITRPLITDGVSANQLAFGSATYDAAGNLYLFGAAQNASNGTQSARSRRWLRSAAALDAPVVFDSTAPTAPYISVRRGPQGGAIDYVYTDGTASPYTVTSGRITLNTAPNAGGKPTPDGQNLDRTVAQSFSYAFSDPDVGDQPSKTDWRWRTSPVSGTPGSWNTSTVTGNATSITYAANTFPAGRIELQVLPYDSQGVVAPAWSESAFDTAANPPTAPTFSAPAAGSTIATSSVTATIVADTLDAHQWRVMGDTSGSANTTVVNAGATIEDPTSRTFTVTGLANAQTVHLQDRRRVGGIWSPWADNGAQAVSYTPPPPATIVLTPLPASAKLSVAWTIPAPTGSEPAVSTVDVYVDDGTAEGLRRIAGTGAVDRAPTASPWVHDTPALLREYGNGTGRVVVVVKGANGTTRTTTS